MSKNWINNVFDISRLGAGRLAILIYHRVLPAPDQFYAGDIDQSQFDSQMRILAKNFNVLPLEEAIDRLYAGRLPVRAACITFDDGYADNFDIAVPILRKYGLTATFFIAVGYLDGGIMFNDVIIEAFRGAEGSRLDLSNWELGCHDISAVDKRIEGIHAVLNKLKYYPTEERHGVAKDIAGTAGVDLPTNLMLSTEKLQQLADSGMDIGGHTVNHPILSNITSEEAMAEMVEGRNRLRSLTGQPVSIFAYPNGVPGRDYRNIDVNMVKKAGFKAGVSTSWATASMSSDRYQLPRLNIWDRTPQKFRLRILKGLLGGREAVV